MDLRDKIGIAICLLFAGVGTMASIIAYVSWQSTSKIIHDGIKTQGVVIENLHKSTTGLQTQSTAMAPVVLFKTTSGKPVTYYSQTYTTPVQYQVGEIVPIWYMADNPQEATLDGVDAWIVPVVVGLFGLVFCLIAYPALISSLLKSRKRNALTKAPY